MVSRRLGGSWSVHAGTAVGCNNHGSYHLNPRYKIAVSSRSKFIARLALNSASAGNQPLNLSLYTPADSSLNLATNASPNGRHVVATSHGGVYSSAQCGVAIPNVELEPGTYLLV